MTLSINGKTYEAGELVAYVEKLEKENAELKTNFKIAKDNEYEYSSLLTKAKELLKEWIVYHGGTREFHSALQDKTEQFLKEMKK